MILIPYFAINSLEIMDQYRYRNDTNRVLSPALHTEVFEKCSHVDVCVIICLEDVASSVTIPTDPRQGRHRLQSQVLIRVLEVNLNQRWKINKSWKWVIFRDP